MLDWPSVEFVDTHCHLNFDCYKADIELVIQRALDLGVTKIIVPGLDLESSREAIELAERYECVYATIGIHPNHSDKYIDSQLIEFEKLAENRKTIGIGEIGLDFYHPHNKQYQLLLIQDMLDLATSLNKPVILHSRNSLKEVIEQVIQRPVTGIFHAFEGNYSDAKELINHHFLLGAGGPVTYKNSFDKQEVFSKIEMQGLVLETDGPFLPPEFFRGSRNEPCRIPKIAQKVAELRNCSVDEIALQTTENVNRLFKWKN